MADVSVVKIALRLSKAALSLVKAPLDTSGSLSPSAMRRQYHFSYYLAYE
jgi:hypothetical protein